MKVLLILVGPKGAGKTYIGALVDKHLDISFLRVEPIWLAYMKDPPKGQSGWEVVEATIDQRFEAHDKVMIESLGAGAAFAAFYASLRAKYIVKLVKVEANLDTCLHRVKTRDDRHHIPVSDDKVEAYNRIAAQVQWPWDQVIDNNGPASEEAILAAIRAVAK